jgi:hypothetical protein
MANPTMSDTKAVILGKYKDLLAEKKALASKTVNPAQEVKAKKVKETVTRANSIPDTSNIESFQTSFVNGMTKFTEEFGTLLNDFNSVKESINTKQAELQELFGIETEAFALTALIDAQQVQKEEYITKIQETHKEAEQRLIDKKEQLNMEIVNLKGQIEDTRRIQSETEQRTRNEFDYNFAREQTETRDKLEDSIASAKKEHKIWMEEQSNEIKDMKDDVLEREELVAEAETELAELKVTVANVPTVIAEQVKAKVAQKEAILNKHYESEAKLVAANASAEVQLLTAKNESLEDKVSEMATQLSDVTSKLDGAYKELRDLASDTVKGAGQKELLAEIRNSQHSNPKARV